MLQTMVTTATHVTSVDNHFSYTYYIIAGVFAAIAIGASAYIASLVYRRVNLSEYEDKISKATFTIFVCALASGAMFIEDPGTTYTIYGNVISAGYDDESYHFINIDGTKVHNDDHEENRRLLNKYVKMTCDTQSTDDSVSSRRNICIVEEFSDKKITPDSRGGSN